MENGCRIAATSKLARFESRRTSATGHPSSIGSYENERSHATMVCHAKRTALYTNPCFRCKISVRMNLCFSRLQRSLVAYRKWIYNVNHANLLYQSYKKVHTIFCKHFSFIFTNKKTNNATICIITMQQCKNKQCNFGKNCLIEKLQL